MTLVRDMPIITGGTVTFTNGSRVVNGTGVGALWRSTRVNAGVTENEDAVGRGYWIMPVDGSAVPVAEPVMVLRLVSATQLELVSPWGGATLTGTAYQIVAPGVVSQAIASEVLRQAAGRGGPSNPFVSALFQNSGRRAGLFLNPDGSLDLGSGPSTTDYPSLTMRRLIGTDGNIAFAAINGSASQVFAVADATDDSHALNRGEGNALYATLAALADKADVSALADKADLAGSASQVFAVADATDDDHAINRGQALSLFTTSPAPVVITASTALVLADRERPVFVDSTSGPVTVTLPAANVSGAPGLTMGPVQWIAGVNAVTIAAAAGDTIDGAASITILRDAPMALVASGATAWRSIGTNDGLGIVDQAMAGPWTDIEINGFSTFPNIGAAQTVNVRLVSSTNDVVLITFPAEPNKIRRVLFDCQNGSPGVTRAMQISTGANLILAGGVDTREIRRGDQIVLVSDSAGVWREVSFSGSYGKARAYQLESSDNQTDAPFGASDVALIRKQVASNVYAPLAQFMRPRVSGAPERVALQAAGYEKRMFSAFPQPGVAALTTTGFTSTQVGTLTAVAPGSNYAGSLSVAEHLVTVAATTAIASDRSNFQFIPNSGFNFRRRWGMATGATVATRRGFCGLRASVAAPTDVNPSTLTNIVGVGFDAADTNLQIMHNDATGAATKLDTGIPRPSVDRGAWFEVHLYSHPGDSVIAFNVLASSGLAASGLITTDLPVGNLALLNYVSVGGTSSVVGLAQMGTWLETNW
jgi:hypothetical protein